jgi:phytoene synthase
MRRTPTLFPHPTPGRESDDAPPSPAAALPERPQQAAIVPAAPEPDLAAAYRHCRAINRHYGKTYYFSTLFFPAHLRPAVHALYAWVRYPDEWVDQSAGPVAGRSTR